MRYKTDENNYIINVYFNCHDGACNEYTGTIPEGYYTLEDWAESATIEAYKIVNGNLVYDEHREAELQEQFEIEAEENATATHKWVRNQLGKSSQVVIDEFSNSVSGASLIVINDSGDYEIPEVKATSETIEEVTVISSNKNLLGIDTLTQTTRGITFTKNKDGSITLNGTATSNIELDLKGTSTNLDMLFLMQKGNDYAISGLTANAILNLYSYDGKDRVLVASGYNKSVNLTTSHKITQATLSIASGKKFENVIITPQVEIGEATDYVKHEESKSSTSLYENEASIYDLYSYNPTTIIMADKEITMEVSYFKYKSLQEEFTKIETASNEIVISVSSVNDRLDILGTNIDETTGEVTSVKTGKGFTFNDEGMNISDPNESFNTQITNKSTQYKNGDETITRTSTEGFMTTDLEVKGTHQYSYDKDNDTYDFVAERIEVDGEYAHAHFYNGGDY